MMECCNCNKNGVLGIVWNDNITEIKLKVALSEIGLEYNIPDHELAVYSIDRESAVKYGKWDKLGLSRTISTLGTYVVNFYKEYDYDRKKGLLELINYVSSHSGTIIMINPDGDEILEELRFSINQSHNVNLCIEEV